MAQAHPNFGVVILANGLGERMKELGIKVLLDINNKPMFGYSVDLARNFQPAETIVTLSEAATEQGSRYLKETERYDTIPPLGTLSAIEATNELFRPEVSWILACQADDAVFYPADIFQKLAERCHELNVNIGITVVNTTTPLSLGSVQTDSRGLITDFNLDRSLPAPKLVPSGIYVFKRELLAQFAQSVQPNQKGERSFCPGWLLSALEHGQAIATLEIPEGQWSNINTPEDLRRARARKENNE